MKRLLTFSLAILMVVGLSAAVVASQNATHDVTCTVDGTRSISAPSPESLTVDRGSSVESGSALSLTYQTDFSSDEITVTASVKSGDTGVSGAALGIQGGTLGTGSYTNLITGDGAGSTVTLKSSATVGGSQTVTDIKFQLDATGVSSPLTKGTFGASWVYEVTYTIQAS